MTDDILGSFQPHAFATAPAGFNGFVTPAVKGFAETIKVAPALAHLTFKWGDEGIAGENTPVAEYVSFSFPSAKAAYPNPYGGSQPTSFDDFSTLQSAAAKHALQRYAEVADINFVDKGTGDAALRYANTSNLAGVGQTSDAGYGEAYQPGSSTTASKIRHGDVWIDVSVVSKNGSQDSADAWAPGSKGQYLILHETGHALGLAHPSSGIDSIDNTVMSIKPFGGSESAKAFYPTTPMPFDIRVAQYIYGPNWEHNTGDTTYTFVLGQDFYETIWDAGGNDTIDFSAAKSPATINLKNGEFSTIHNDGGTFRVAIAFEVKDANGNVVNVIENAIGGSGNDTIRGNDAPNSLTGNAGNDYLSGELGDDSLDGGDGLDRLDGGFGKDSLDGGNGLDKLYGGADNDTIAGGPGNDEALGGDGNDLIEMGDGNDWARGGAGNDTLDGGPGENKLYGDGGDDTLVGKPTLDRLIGSYSNDSNNHPDGTDIFKIVADDIPRYVTGQNNTILYGFGHRLDTREIYGNGDKIDLREFGGGGWKLIHSSDALAPGTIKVANHDIKLWTVGGDAVSQLFGKDKDGDYFQLFIDDGSANGSDYRVRDFIGVTSDFSDLL